MKKAFRKILRLMAVLVALLILAVAAVVLLFLFDKPLVKNILQTQLGKRTGMNVRAGKLDYSLFPFHLTVEALELGRENNFQKWDLSVARLEARGDFWNLVRGTKPAIETIAAEGAVIRLEQKAHSEAPLDLKAIIIQAADTIGLARRATVRNSRLTVFLPTQIADLENCDISLTSKDEKEGLAFSLDRAEVNVKDRSGSFSFRSRLTASGTLHLASPLGFEAALAFDSPQVAVAGIKESLPLVRIEAAGRLEPASKELAVSQLKISVPDLLDVEGTAGSRFGQGFSLEAAATVRCERLEKVMAVLEPRLPAGLRKSGLRGRAVLTGKYEMQRSSQGTTDSLAGSLTFEGVELDHVVNRLPLHIRASGKIQASGPSRAPRLSADIRSSIGKAALANFSFGHSDLHIIAAATKEDVNISRLDGTFQDLSFDVADGMRLSFDHIALTGKAGLKLGWKAMVLNSLEAQFDAALQNLFFAAAGGKSLSFDNVTLKGKASLDVGKKMMVFNSLEARFSGIAPLVAEGQFGLGKTPAVRVRIESRNLDIPGLRALAAPFIPESLAGWELGGTAGLSLEVRRPASAGADWGFSGSLSLGQARFNDPSFTIAGEGLDPMLKVEGEYAASKGLSFRGALDISQGESLWKAVYVSWSKHPLKLTAAGRYHLDRGGMDGLEIRFLLPTIGEVNLSGSAITRPLLSFNLRSDAGLSLGPLYSLTTEAGVSEVNRMTIGGTLRAGLHIFKKGQALSVTGKLNLTDASLERPMTRTVLVDVDAELPINCQFGIAAVDSPEIPLPEEGFLRIGEFRNPLFALRLVSVPLRVGANSFSIEPFSLELYGGRIELGRTTFRFDPGSGSIQGVGSLALHDLDIARLPIQSPQFNLTGKIQAEFPRLDIRPKEIMIFGRGEADVFGGKVVLRDLAVSDPFTPGRSISLNADLLDLDLKKLTQEVPFGEVTGIVRGEVRNLVISYGQPEQFEFRLESVPRKGVSQTFSLKAVDNLTVLSAGQQATAGTSQFWMRFIRGFRYEKLGIVSTLRNDTFTLNGTIHEGGVEYLVKKPALFGINVINRMPEKVISFKEMTNRLKRVGQSEK